MTKKDKETSQRMFLMMSSPFTEVVPTWMEVAASSHMLFDLFVASLEQPV